MKRSDFLVRSGAVSLAAASSRALPVRAAGAFRPGNSPWHTYEITVSVRLVGSGTPARTWIPVPAFDESDWMKPGATTWSTNAASAQLVRSSPTGPMMLYAQWTNSPADRHLESKSVVTARDLSVDFSQPRPPVPLPADLFSYYTAATELMPTGGIVGETSRKIVGDATTDLEKAKRIYDWVVTNSSRNPKTRGCGLGNVAFMLQTGDLSGKCADINGLYVALARASGIPARDLYGIRVAPSRFGYHSLGANSNVITKSQHCRAEVYLQQYGWVPVDPADVRKVMLEEPPTNLTLDDPKVADARKALFGTWEGNYVAYNDAHDVDLPGSTGQDLGFLMYPQAEIDNVRKDALAPDDFIYTIESRVLT